VGRLNLNIKDGLLASDTETTGINPWGDYRRWNFYPARPFAFSFCDSEGNTDYIRWEVDPRTRKVIVKESDLRTLKDIYADPMLTHIGHNFAYDFRMLRFTGVHVKGRIHDTLIMGHVVTGGSELTYALKPLGEKYLGVGKDDERDLQEDTKRARNKGKKLGWKLADKESFGKEPIKADYWMADPNLCKRYAIQDAVRTMLFFRLWYPDIQKDAGMLATYSREMKLFYLVRRMEDRGVRIFAEDVVRLRKFYETYIDTQLKLADQSGGRGLNFKSHKQMIHKFYVEKGYKPKISEKSGNPSLDGDKLSELSHVDPLAKAILEFRNANHAIISFLNPYDKFRVEESSGVWVLHPNFKQCGPVTGRFSCGDPNLMQVASESTGRRRSEVTMRPREAFGPREGCVWYLPDYSQMEVWVFAFIAKDDTMMKILMSGRDFHGQIAESVWGKNSDYEEKKSYYRKRAKLLMFCKLYGGGAKKLAYLLRDALEVANQKTIENEICEARLFIEQYDRELPGVGIFQKRMINRVRREGKIVNSFGRVYFIDPNFAYRGVNYIVQGTCADILKQAMLNVGEIIDRWSGCELLLTLHDELIVEVPLKYHSKKLMRQILKAMQGNFHKVLGIPRPLPIGMKIAERRWSNTKEIEL